MKINNISNNKNIFNNKIINYNIKNKNKNKSLSFKANNIQVPNNKCKVVESIWNKLFPNLQSGLVKRSYKNLISINNDKYSSDEVKYYYKKNHDNVILKIFENCNLDKNKNITTASKIFYQYDTQKNKDLKQKIIINPQFDKNGRLIKAQYVHEYYENQADKKQFVIHSNVKFRDEKIVFTKSTEITYDDDTKETYKNAFYNIYNEIYDFDKKERLNIYKQNNKSIKEKLIWLNSNHEDLKPDFYIIQEKTKEKPDIKIYIENPVFRNDYTIESAKLSQKIIDNEISYTDYKPEYDKNGNIEKSKLHRVKKLNVDIEKTNIEVKEIQKEIDYLYTIEKKNFNERKKLKEEEKKLDVKSYVIQKQNRHKLQKNKSDNAIFLNLEIQKPFTSKFKSLLGIYDNVDNEEKVNKNNGNLLELLYKINKDKEILQNKAKELEEITNKNMIKIRELQSKLADIISYDKVYYDYKYGKENLVFSTKIYGKINSILEFQRRDLINDD